MTTSRILAGVAAGAFALSMAPLAAAQTTTTQEPSQQQERIGAILGALFGDRLGVTTSVEAQWTAGRRPLQTQRTQFNTRIDAEVRSGALTRANGDRLKAEYDEVVALETRYGADGRFTTQERNELADRYGAITQALTDGGYIGGGSGSTTLGVANGRTEFDRRVDAAVSTRRLSRTEGTRLKADYAALITVESGYARDGISSREQEDLDARLDALDARVGDVGYGGGNTVIDNRTRLSNIERALPNAGLSSAARAQLLVEHGDLVRLEAAYSRTSPSSDDRSYLDRRLTDLETRARVRR